MILIVSKRFDGDLKKLLKGNRLYKKKVFKCLNLLASGLKYPSLRLHKLSGNENYSASVDMSIRIIFHLEGEKIFLLKIGPHEEVY